MFRALTQDAVRPDSSFPTLFKQKELIDWEFSYVDEDLKPEDLLIFPGRPAVLLIDAGDTSLIEKIRRMEKGGLPSLSSPLDYPIVLSPVIVIFRSTATLEDIVDFPDMISDWMFEPIMLPDLVRRIFSSLRRKNILKTELRFGPLTISPESRMISYYGNTVHLSPSEFALVELFLNQMGTVIPMSELVQLFKLTGKSTEGSNIRVTIFQLRLKLETLTNAQFTLSSIYKRGYCLKQKIKPFQEPGSGSIVAKQDQGEYLLENSA